MDKNFLWGGASTASQCEGAYLEAGKGLSIMDVMTNGSKEVEKLRMASNQTIIIRIMTETDSMNIIKRISL